MVWWYGEFRQIFIWKWWMEWHVTRHKPRNWARIFNTNFSEFIFKVKCCEKFAKVQFKLPRNNQRTWCHSKFIIKNVSTNFTKNSINKQFSYKKVLNSLLNWIKLSKYLRWIFFLYCIDKNTFSSFFLLEVLLWSFFRCSFYSWFHWMSMSNLLNGIVEIGLI